MANFRVELTKLELDTIIGEYVQQKHALSKVPVDVIWLGSEPSGAVIKSSPLMGKSEKNIFEDY